MISMLALWLCCRFHIGHRYVGMSLKAGPKALASWLQLHGHQTFSSTTQIRCFIAYEVINSQGFSKVQLKRCVCPNQTPIHLNFYPFPLRWTRGSPSAITMSSTIGLVVCMGAAQWRIVGVVGVQYCFQQSSCIHILGFLGSDWVVLLLWI